MSSLTPKELNQLVEETGLSKLAIQDWHRRFIHECPNGHLSKDRYIHLYRSYYPRARNSDSYAQMFFVAFDDDHDQALNFREFLHVVTITQGTDDKMKLEIAFKAYNHNQVEANLSRKDMQPAIISLLDLAERQDDEDNQEKRETIMEWALQCLGFDEKNDISRKHFLRRCKENRSLFEFLAFHSVPKPNCPDGDIHGKDKYKISIRTGSEGKKLFSFKSSGTNADVFLILHGEMTDSEPIQLQHSQTHKDLFEHGHTDVFTQFLPALGELKSATLWHTGDHSQGWYVEDVSVVNESLNLTTYFPVQRWLDAEEYDKTTKIELLPNQPPGYAQ